MCHEYGIPCHAESYHVAGGRSVSPTKIGRGSKISPLSFGWGSVQQDSSTASYTMLL